MEKRECLWAFRQANIDPNAGDEVELLSWSIFSRYDGIVSGNDRIELHRVFEFVGIYCLFLVVVLDLIVKNNRFGLR